MQKHVKTKQLSRSGIVLTIYYLIIIFDKTVSLIFPFSFSTKNVYLNKPYITRGIDSIAVLFVRNCSVELIENAYNEYDITAREEQTVMKWLSVSKLYLERTFREFELED